MPFLVERISEETLAEWRREICSEMCGEVIFAQIQEALKSEDGDDWSWLECSNSSCYSDGCFATLMLGQYYIDKYNIDLGEYIDF